MNKITLSVIASLLLMVVIGCTKYPDLYDDERTKDLTLTLYDNTNDFTPYLTYSIVDTVGNLFEAEEGDTNTLEPSKYSELIINQINSNMASLGYTKVDTSANPDLFINAHTLGVDINYIGSYYPYYGWGGGGYWGYPGYGYYYPYYYSYTKSFGTVILEMIDAKNRNDQTNQLTVVWNASILGATNSSSAANSRITSGIDDAFAQSPYLKK
jgi:hypothetical protein